MFPTDYTVHVPNREFMSWKDPVEKTMYNIIMADCWGIQVHKPQGVLNVLDSYSDGPDTRHEDTVNNLMAFVDPGDSIVVYMYGTNGYKVVFTRTMFGYRIKCFASENFVLYSKPMCCF